MRRTLTILASLVLVVLAGFNHHLLAAGSSADASGKPDETLRGRPDRVNKTPADLSRIAGWRGRRPDTADRRGKSPRGKDARDGSRRL